MAKKYVEGFSREKVKSITFKVPYSIYLELKTKAQEDGFSLYKLLGSLVINYIRGDINGDMQDKRNPAL